MIKEGLLVNMRFDLVKKIGHGSFGDVWSAIDILGGCSVAIKFVSITPFLMPKCKQQCIDSR
jgi:serine/threonine protein kinase